MRQFIILSTLLAVSLSALAQERIDGSYDFQTESGKKYSLYIPSNYDKGTANPLMVGLHPFNPDRWDAESWCDTLIAFAEANNLILACPDGGPEGRIDQPIDTAFTTSLIDSVLKWYNIDEERIYLMGFSMGGKATYTYGLTHSERFAGFMPIGAAMAINYAPVSIRSGAADKPWYVIHGSEDWPDARFTPLVDMLKENFAIVESQLLQGVGHTIDFPDRNNILTTGYKWMDSVRQATSITPPAGGCKPSITYQASARKLTIENACETGSDVYTVSIIDLSGKLIYEANLHDTQSSLPLNESINGVHIIRVRTAQATFSEKIAIF